MDNKTKDLLTKVFALVLIVVAVIWFMNSDLEHIEDTNGPDDYSLTTITDENIIAGDMGSLNPVTVKKKSLDLGSVKISSGVEFSSKKFTGVYEILYDNYILPSDFVLDLTSFEVTEGNLRMVVVHNDEIIAELEPGMFVEYRIDDIKGYVSLRIAGESASYKFYMSETDYNMHTHD